MSAIETNADIFSDANQTRIVLASKGKRNKKPCTVLPVLCHLLDRMPSATQCRRGEVRERERDIVNQHIFAYFNSLSFPSQTKILLLPGPVHIPPHVGLTNTNLRALLPLALSGPLKIRMNKDTRYAIHRTLLCHATIIGCSKRAWSQSSMTPLNRNCCTWERGRAWYSV